MNRTNSALHSREKAVPSRFRQRPIGVATSGVVIFLFMRFQGAACPSPDGPARSKPPFQIWPSPLNWPVRAAAMGPSEPDFLQAIMHRAPTRPNKRTQQTMAARATIATTCGSPPKCTYLSSVRAMTANVPNAAAISAVGSLSWAIGSGVRDVSVAVVVRHTGGDAQPGEEHERTDAQKMLEG